MLSSLPPAAPLLRIHPGLVSRKIVSGMPIIEMNGLSKELQKMK